MDLENAKIVDMYDRLFAEQGWKELIQDLRERNENFIRSLVSNPSNEKDLFYVKGYVAANQYLISLEDSMDQAKKAGMMDHQDALPDV